MKEIKLTRGQVSIVDDEDFEKVNIYKWQAHYDPSTKSFYATRSVRISYKKRGRDSIHRMVMGLLYGDKREIDHINHNTLDNRKENLKIVTKRENASNRLNQSKLGVGIRKTPKNRYQAYINIGYKQIHLGIFDTLEEAKKAREIAVIERKIK